MKTLLFIACFIFGIYLGSLIIRMFKLKNKIDEIINDTTDLKPKNCPPHKWQEDETGHLICSVCQFRPQK